MGGKTKLDELTLKELELLCRKKTSIYDELLVERMSYNPHYLDILLDEKKKEIKESSTLSKKQELEKERIQTKQQFLSEVKRTIEIEKQLEELHFEIFDIENFINSKMGLEAKADPRNPDQTESLCNEKEKECIEVSRQNRVLTKNIKDLKKEKDDTLVKINGNCFTSQELEENKAKLLQIEPEIKNNLKNLEELEFKEEQAHYELKLYFKMLTKKVLGEDFINTYTEELHQDDSIAHYSDMIKEWRLTVHGIMEDLPQEEVVEREGKSQNISPNRIITERLILGKYILLNYVNSNGSKTYKGALEETISELSEINQEIYNWCIDNFSNMIKWFGRFRDWYPCQRDNEKTEAYLNDRIPGTLQYYSTIKLRDFIKGNISTKNKQFLT